MRSLDNVVIALGYFDSVHVGHREVIRQAKALAEKLNSRLVVFTFEGNLRAIFGEGAQKRVYSSKEREKLLKKLGADQVFFAPTSEEFLSLDKFKFLDRLNEIYDIKGYVSGRDYRFGKSAEGTVLDLEKYADKKGQILLVAEDVSVGGKRVSTSLIKELLSTGKIEEANLLLGEEFFITGRVIKDRGVGKKLGFPTANVIIDFEKQSLKFGVYGGKIQIDDEEYKAIVNVGKRPTYSIENSVIEAHLLGFDGDLYDREITVKFTKFLRETVKFSSEKKLIEQLEKDKDRVEKDD